MNTTTAAVRAPATTTSVSAPPLRAARAVSVVLAAAMGVSAAAGLAVRDLYRDPGAVVALLRGYDLIALAAVALLVAASTLLVPGYVLAGVLLWRRAVWGYAVAIALMLWQCGRSESRMSTR